MPLESERKLTISLPASVLRQLRDRTARDETTARALVLEALALAGYRIPMSEIRDRRRRTEDDSGHGTSFTIGAQGRVEG